MFKASVKQPSQESLLPPAYDDPRASISSESQPLLVQGDGNAERPFVNPKWFADTVERKDRFFFVLFYVNLAVTLALSVVGVASVGILIAAIRKLHPSPDTPPTEGPAQGTFFMKDGANNTIEWDWEVTTPQLIGLPITALTVGLLITTLFYRLLVTFKSTVLKVCTATLTVFFIAVAALSALTGLVFNAVFFAMFALFAGLVTVRWFRGTSVVGKLFDAVLDAVAEAPGMIWAAVVGGVVDFVMAVGWAFAVAGAFVLFGAFQEVGAKWGPLTVVLAYLSLSWLWISQVISNVVHVTLAGVFATYHLTGVADEDGKVTVAIRRPVTAAAKRALGPSFGSIAFGSLILALLSWVSGLLRKAQEDGVGSGNTFVTLLFCCFRCIFTIFHDLIQFLNKYAFTYVAIYGEDYCTSAKATFSLMKERGLDVVATDAGANMAIMASNLAVVSVAGGLGPLAGYFMGVPFQFAPMMVVAIVFVLFAAIAMSAVARVLETGAAATAEDPVAVSRTRPALVDAVAGAYPDSGFARAVIFV
ncbi:putative choline transporter, neither null mutation nor overexpression affects choline transport [Dinochytrium kinnereticum]|nr:putative choline transporter, neither null mutation nor overexpression affects choline transport [Dinochytrium kinnereticum]